MGFLEAIENRTERHRAVVALPTTINDNEKKIRRLERSIFKLEEERELTYQQEKKLTMLHEDMRGYLTHREELREALMGAWEL